MSWTRSTFLIALLVLIFAAPAQAAMTPCFGAPSDYVTAFTALDGSSGDGAVKYPEPRFWHEWQSWATPEGATPGHHSEHMHLAACIPNGNTMTATFRLDLGFTFHRMVDYKITSLGMSGATAGESEQMWAGTAADIAKLEAAMDASGSGTPTKAYFSKQTQMPTSEGLKEARGVLAVVRDGPLAIFEQWRLDSRWYFTYDFPNHPLGQPVGAEHIRYLRLRSLAQWRRADGTLSGLDYHHSGWCGHPVPSPGSSTWTRADVLRTWGTTKTMCLRATDGGGQAWLEIDPNHHIHSDDPGGEERGVWFKDLGNSKTWPINPTGGGAFELNVTIPVSTIGLSPGVHKLVFLSDDSAPGRGTWTNVNVLPFRVG